MFLKSGLVVARKLLRRRTSVNKIFKAYAHVDPEMQKIGMREVVGMGSNGQPTYCDRPDFPCPAIRFMPDNPYLKALREKEKGDWRSLSIDEKKCLYRASFCQTFAEFNSWSGEWKSVVGWALFHAAIGIWLLFFIQMFAYEEGSLPESFNLENRQAQLKRMIDLRINPIHGLTSKIHYDTFKDEYKDQEE